MRNLICLILLFAVGPALAEEEQGFRFGGLLSANSYTIDDPDGKTPSGAGVAVSGVAFYEMNRSARLAFDVSRSSYTLTATSVNVGQDVKDTSGSISYQRLWRLTREIKPWVGAGVGYSSATYSNRHTLTPSGLYSIPYADRTEAKLFYLLNSNIEWPLNNDFSVGLNAQFRQALSGAAQSFRIGVYVIY